MVRDKIRFPMLSLICTPYLSGNQKKLFKETFVRHQKSVFNVHPQDKWHSVRSYYLIFYTYTLLTLSAFMAGESGGRGGFGRGRGGGGGGRGAPGGRGGGRGGARGGTYLISFPLLFPSIHLYTPHPSDKLTFVPSLTLFRRRIW